MSSLPAELVNAGFRPLRRILKRPDDFGQVVPALGHWSESDCLIAKPSVLGAALGQDVPGYEE
jgi:hypothetical protein